MLARRTRRCLPGFHDSMTPPTTPAGSPLRIAHIGIAVESIDGALPFYRDVLGMPVVPIENADGARIAAVTAGEALIELLEPATPGSPIDKFIARRGPGIHHVCFATPIWVPRSNAAGRRVSGSSTRYRE